MIALDDVDFRSIAILVLSRLTSRMGINDDLHANGPLSCISQGSLFVYLVNISLSK